MNLHNAFPLSLLYKYDCQIIRPREHNRDYNLISYSCQEEISIFFKICFEKKLEENADIPKCLLSDTSKPQIATFGGSHAFCGRRKLVKGQTKNSMRMGNPLDIEFSCFLPAWNRSVFCNPSLCLPVSDPPSFLGAFSFDGDKARQGRSNPLRCEDSRELFAAAPGRENPDTAHKRNARSKAAEKDRAAAGLLPFLTFSAAFQATLAKTALFFQAADATFAARCDRAKINLPIHTITIPAPC